MGTYSSYGDALEARGLEDEFIFSWHSRIFYLVSYDDVPTFLCECLEAGMEVTLCLDAV